MLTALAFAGGLLGSLNLIIGGALDEGTWPRLVYASTMVTCLGFGVVTWRRPALLDRAGLSIVIFSDLLFVVIAWTIKSPELYSTPLMLLFAALLAAWLLDTRVLPIHLVAVYGICWFVLAPSIPQTRLLVVQIIVQGTVLNGATVLVHLLRLRSERLLSQMHQASVTDQLTGLPNRRSLEERAPEFWREAAEQGHQVAALILDLDHFKSVNDQHGHATGDLVLREMARAVRQALRSQDLVARTGGEEFVVLTAVPGPEPVAALAARIHQALAARPLAMQVTVSIGIALDTGLGHRDAAEATWRLIDRADRAMYEAKSRGRNRSVLLDPSSDEVITLQELPVPQATGHQVATT